MPIITPNLTPSKQSPAVRPTPAAPRPTRQEPAPQPAPVVPAPSAQTRATSSQLNMGLAELPPQVMAVVDRLPDALKGKLGAVAAGLGGSDLEITHEVRVAWTDLIGQTPGRTAVDVNSLVQFVLREAYMENTKDLHFFAEKVRFYNDIKKKYRDELTRAREMLAKMAGQDEDALLPGPFVPTDIDATYTGATTTDPGAQAPAGSTSAAQAQLTEQQANVEAYRAAQAAWQAMPAVTDEVSFGAIAESGNSHSNKVDDDDVYDTMMNGGGDAWIDNVVAWFNSLPNEQQDALVEKWKSDGMSFYAYAHETEGLFKRHDDTGEYNEKRTLPAGKSPTQWLRDECKRAIQQVASEITKNDGGSRLKLADFNFKITPPKISVERRPDKPAELVALEQKLGITPAPADDAAAETVSFGKIEEKGNNHSHRIDDDDVFETIMNGGGRTWIDNVVAWFRSLPAAQRDALVETWKTDGMAFYATAEETQFKDDTGTYNQRRTLPAGKNPIDWLKDECERAIRTSASSLTSADSGNHLKLSSFSFHINPPDVKVVPSTTSTAGGLTAASAGFSAGQPPTTKAELETYIQNTEERLNSVGDDAQLANVDLQNMLQKQQQTLQMMSNIAKMLHDTAMAVIRKIGS